MKPLFHICAFVTLNLVSIHQLKAKEYVTLGIDAAGHSIPWMNWEGTTNIIYCENESVDVTFNLNNYTGYCNTMDWKIYKNNLIVDSGLTNYTTYFINSPGTYRVEYTLGISCASGTFYINIRQGLPIPTITLDNQILWTQWGYSYRWYFEGNEIIGAASDSYFPIVSGSYQVKINDSRGCENISAPFEFTLTVTDPPSAVEELTTGLLFPNPNNGVFNFSYSLSENHFAELVLQDITGQTISMHQLPFGTQSTLSINQENLSVGYYFCRILLDGKLFATHPFVIAK